MLEDTNLHKLITKEDTLHFHKVLGIFSLGHYIYRYNLLLFYGSMFINTPTDIAMVAVHGLLSVSSFIFHIPMKRHAKLPMIYPEYRLHSIVFALRSVACCFIEYSILSTNKYYYKIATCFGTMIVADIITHIYYVPGDTTMRAMPFSETHQESDKKLVTHYHTMMQAGATMYMLYNMESAFSPMFAIQLAAFLMTLVRKNIIKPNTWHLVYSWALMTNALVYNSLPISQTIIIFIGVAIFDSLRVKLRMNKYVCWTIIFSVVTMLDLSIVDSYVEYNQFIAKFVTSVAMTFYFANSFYKTQSLYYK